jgi:hypothetical protein
MENNNGRLIEKYPILNSIKLIKEPQVDIPAT